MRKLDTTQSGFYEWCMDELVQFIMQMIYDVVSLFAVQGNCIISGCQYSQISGFWEVSPGWIAYNGTVYYTAGALTAIPTSNTNPAASIYFTVLAAQSVTPSPLPFESGGAKNVCTLDTIGLSTSAIGTTGIFASLPNGFFAAGIWNVVGAAGQPAFNSGWSAADSSLPRFRIDKSGRFTLDGHAHNPSSLSAGFYTLFTLPVGYRPAFAKSYSGVSNYTDTYYLNITTAGDVNISISPPFSGVITGIVINLEQVSFYID